MSIERLCTATVHTLIAVLVALVSSVPSAAQERGCGRWVRVPSPNAEADATFLGGISGVAANDVWSVGWYRVEHPSDFDEFPFALHWDGQRWNSEPIPEPPVGLDHKTRLSDVTAVSATEVWAVGDYIPPDSVNTIETLAMRWDGNDWDFIPSPVAQIGSGSAFYAIDSKGDEIWAVGYSLGSAGTDNLAARWNGSDWEEYHPIRINNGDHQFNAVHIASEDLTVAVGGVGPLALPYVAQWDGSSWSEVLPRIDSDQYLGLTSVISFAPDDIWVGASKMENLVFQEFVYLHYDGSSWVEHPSVEPLHFPRLEGEHPKRFYSGGYRALARLNGRGARLVGSLPVETWTIDDITVLPSGIVFGSGNTFDTGSPETLMARYRPCSPGTAP